MPEPAFIGTAGYETAYHDIGRGAPVLLLHGSGAGVSGWGSWQRTVPALAERFRLIVPDLAGFGATRPPAGYAYSVAAWTDQAVALMDALDIRGAAVIGNSMGGRIAQRLAVVHPERVTRMVLIGAASPRPFQSAALAATRAYKPDLDRMRRMLEDCLVHDPAIITDEIAEARYRISAMPGLQDQFEAMFSGNVVTDDVVSFASLAQVRHSTLVLHGREDRVVPCDHGWDLARTIPNAELHLLPNCGHWTQFEAADRCNELMSGFIARN